VRLATRGGGTSTAPIDTSAEALHQDQIDVVHSEIGHNAQKSMRNFHVIFLQGGRRRTPDQSLTVRRHRASGNGSYTAKGSERSSSSLPEISTRHSVAVFTTFQSKNAQHSRSAATSLCSSSPTPGASRNVRVTSPVVRDRPTPASAASRRHSASRRVPSSGPRVQAIGSWSRFSDPSVI
jgi:hypothetical protein